MDLVVTTGYGPIFSRKGYVSVLEGTGGALAADPTTVRVEFFPEDADVADLDGDGDVDIVTTSAGDELVLLFNEGSRG
ncbi:MAG: hypothetical protein ACR2JK_15870 [Geodermatophilaceae bacterium]